MNRAAYEPNYDPSNFIHDYADDEQLQLALKAAEELSVKVSQPLPDETAIDTERRIDQAFDLLRTDVDKQLDSFHDGERSGIKKLFLHEREKEIIADYQKGIDSTNDPNLKMGGQFARDEKIRMLHENINSNPAFKAEVDRMSNFQAARSEAISNAIKYTPPAPDLATPSEPPTPPSETPPTNRKSWESEAEFAERQKLALDHAKSQLHIKPTGPTHSY